jgi:Bacterial PH domain
LNGIELDSFGTKKELGVLHDYLEPDEVVFALTSGIMEQTQTSNTFDFGLNTWLVVLTSQRFLFLDHAMLTTSVDTQSIRHDRVQAVSSSQGFLLGKIMVDIGSRVVVVDNCQKPTVSVIANLANKWINENHSKAAPPPPTAPPSSDKSSVESPIDKLERAAKLHSIGALTDEQFERLKEKILSEF